jgi:DNA-directed RNA polymerase subunit RPC12/RpoP
VAEFVPPQSVGKFIIPILVIVVLAIVGSSLFPILLTRGKLINLAPGSERKYGIGGGGICSKCHRPFALPLFSMNLGFSKFARCPYCGKWGVVRVQALAKLREAEKAELEWGKEEAVETSEEERLRKELDDSKYQGA